MSAQSGGEARFDVLNNFLMKIGGMKGTLQEAEVLVGIMHATAMEARSRGYVLNLAKDGEVRAVRDPSLKPDPSMPMVIISKSVMQKLSIDDLLKVGRRKITPKKGEE